MKNTILLFTIITILFSCQHRTEIKRKRSAVTKDTISNQEIKVDTITEKDLDTTETKKNKSEEIVSDEGEVILLPNNLYAVVILDYYENKKEEDPEKKWVAFPVKVKVYDRKTKKQVPEIKFDGYFEEEHDDNFDDTIFYGDFNFDGKMDVAVRGKELGYRSFYHWNFYLATSKGYKFSKSFSKIMDWPIANFELDKKNKKIIAYREAEYYGIFEYKVKKNKASLFRTFSSSRPSIGPFYSSSEDYWNGDKRISYKEFINIRPDILEKDYKYSVLSFEINKSEKNIMIFVDDDTGKLCYTLLKRKDSTVIFGYSETFNYKIKDNLLGFKDQNIDFKVFDDKNHIGIEITKGGKTTRLVGDIKTKKGSLSRLITIKKDFEKEEITNVKNILIEK